MLYDKDIREPLFDYFEDKYGKTRVIEEKRMGQSRADVVIVIENALIGIEIKSDADTYARLSNQIKDYEKYFDYNYVAVGSKHASNIEKYVPVHWGVISVEKIDDKVDFYLIREASVNPNNLMINKLSLLWRMELANIQEKNQMFKYKEKSKAFVIEKIKEKVPKEILDGQISHELFERDYTTVAQTIAKFRQENNKKPRKKKKIGKKYKIKLIKN